MKRTLKALCLNPFPLFALPVAALLVFAEGARADELFVDSSGLGDFVSIQAAVDAAVDGDVIIVRPGIYAEDVLINDKSVQVVGQLPLLGEVQGGLVIQNIGPTKRVDIMDLKFIGQETTSARVLTIGSSEGSIHLQGLEMTGALDGFGPAPYAASAQDVDRLTITDCTFIGGGSFGSCGIPGNPGFEITNSRVAIWGSTIHGGPGGSCTFNDGSHGGLAVRLTGSEVLFSGCFVQGGTGGSTGDWSNSGNGGNGLHASTTSSVQLHDTAILGGNQGTSPFGPLAFPGTPVSGGVVPMNLPGQSHALTVDAFVPVGSLTSITVEGPVGNQAVLLIYSAPQFYFDAPQRVFSPGNIGVATAVAAPLAMIRLGAIPAGGVLQTGVVLPDFTQGDATEDLHMVVRSERSRQGSLLAVPKRFIEIDCSALVPDCDASGRSDLCELIDGTSSDCDFNGIPDGCEADCNNNGIADSCDISSGASADQNGDGVPDECQPMNTTWYVDANAALGGDGSFSTPFRDIQTAVDTALTGDSVALFDGVYQGARNRGIELDGARVFDIRSLNGPANCTLDLQGTNRAFDFVGGSSVLGATIEGIRFINGLAIVPSASGGAIRIRSTRPTIRNCVFENNTAPIAGGAIEGWFMSPRIEQCVFRNNIANQGGAIHTAGDDVIIRDSQFFGNQAAWGGALNLNGYPTEPIVVSRCRFLGNTAGSTGGAIYAAGGGLGVPGPGVSHFIDQCLFAGNQAPLGGAFSCQNGDNRIANCTIVENIGTVLGGGIHVAWSAEIEIHNTIMSGNVAPSGNEIALDGNGSLVDLAHSTVDGGIGSVDAQNGGGLNSISVVYALAPIFVDADGADDDPLTFMDNDYRLETGSVQIDAGDNLRIPADRSDEDGDGDLTEFVSVDLNGSPRRLDDPNAPDTGQGTAPIVDQGAFER